MQIAVIPVAESGPLGFVGLFAGGQAECVGDNGFNEQAGILKYTDNVCQGGGINADNRGAVMLAIPGNNKVEVFNVIGNVFLNRIGNRAQHCLQILRRQLQFGDMQAATV